MHQKLARTSHVVGTTQYWQLTDAKALFHQATFRQTWPDERDVKVLMVGNFGGLWVWVALPGATLETAPLKGFWGVLYYYHALALANLFPLPGAIIAMQTSPFLLFALQGQSARISIVARISL